MTVINNEASTRGVYNFFPLDQTEQNKIKGRLFIICGFFSPISALNWLEGVQHNPLQSAVGRHHFTVQVSRILRRGHWDLQRGLRVGMGLTQLVRNAQVPDNPCQPSQQSLIRCSLFSLTVTRLWRIVSHRRQHTSPPRLAGVKLHVYG